MITSQNKRNNSAAISRAFRQQIKTEPELTPFPRQLVKKSSHRGLGFAVCGASVTTRIAKIFVCTLFLAACAKAPGFVGEDRTDENVGKVFDQHKQQIYSLYSDALRITPNLAGRVVFRITLDPEGNVIRWTVVESTLEGSELAERLSKLIAKMKFGRVRHRVNSTFLYPIQFAPAKLITGND